MELFWVGFQFVGLIKSSSILPIAMLHAHDEYILSCSISPNNKYDEFEAIIPFFIM